MAGKLTWHKSHENQQLLSASQEEVLVDWIKVQGHCGVPLTYSTLSQYAAEVAEKPVGASWPKRFLARHRDLKVKVTTGLEKARAKALNKPAVDDFFDKLTKLIEEFNITPENTYNMDEKGIQLGIGARIAALVDREQKQVYSIEDGNRELVTIIETVCADGSSLHPSVIFQAKRRSSRWGAHNPCNARCVTFLKPYRNCYIVG